MRYILVIKIITQNPSLVSRPDARNATRMLITKANRPIKRHMLQVSTMVAQVLPPQRRSTIRGLTFEVDFIDD